MRRLYGALRYVWQPVPKPRADVEFRAEFRAADLRVDGAILSHTHRARELVVRRA
jgi:hypothetical protein